jgi:hypothetical protein
MKDLKTRANGDEAKMLRLAQNMANTLGVSPDSLDKAFRRAKAAEMVYPGPLGKKIAKIFMDISVHNKSAAAKAIDWEELGKFNKQTTVTVGDEEITIDIIKDEVQIMTVECSKFDVSYPLDSVSFDRAMIAAEKFINALTSEIIQDETKTKELLWAMFGQNTGAAVIEEYKGIEIKTGFDSSSEIITLYIDGAFYHGGPEFKNDAEAVKYAKKVIDNNPTYYTESSINEDNINPNSIALRKKEWIKILNKSTAASTLTDKEQKRDDSIKRIVDESQYEKIDGVTIDGVTANLLLQICDAFDEEKKKKFLSLEIRKMVNVAWKLSK